MISEEYRLRIAIDKILSSKHIGFYRFCGRELQIKYRAANLTKNNPDRSALLKEIIDVYNKRLDEVEVMGDKERKHKKKLILQYANKQWGKN